MIPKPEQPAQLEVLIDGAGMMGSIGPGIWRQAGAEIYAVTGIDANEVAEFIAAQRLRNIGRAGTFKDLKTLLEDENIDIMNVAVPNQWHYEHTMQALEAGKDVLIEKPMTTTLEDADALLSWLSEESNPALAVQVNSQYRYHELLNIHLRKAIQEGKLGDIELGKPEKITMGYLQGWQADPTGDIGWRPIVKMAGKGKLIGDLGAHLITTTYHLFDGGKFTDFDSKQYNVHATRYAWAGPKGKTFEQTKRPSPAEAPDKWQEMDMLSAQYSGDDRAFANFKFTTPSGIVVPGEYALSQVDPGNENGMYIQLDFEKGAVIWDQENPNHFILKMKDGAEKRYERHSNPGMIGRPSGHPHGYGDAMLIEIDDFLTTIESRDDKRIRDYSIKNVKHSRDAVDMIKQWTGTPLIEKDAEDSSYVAKHRKGILGR